MYKIFVGTNINFGEWSVITETNKDTANIIAMDFIHSNLPVITYAENRYKIWNLKQKHQPQKIDLSEYPKINLAASTFENAILYDLDWLGLFELYAWNYDEKLGAKRITQFFYSYKSEILFKLEKID